MTINGYPKRGNSILGTVEPRPDAAEKWVDHLENDNKAFMYCAVTNITIPSFLQEYWNDGSKW